MFCIGDDVVLNLYFIEWEWWAGVEWGFIFAENDEIKLDLRACTC